MRHLLAAGGRALAVRFGRFSEITMYQTTLTGEADDEPAETPTTEQASSSSNQMNLAPEDQRGGEGC
jgi:hypothetical protein